MARTAAHPFGPSPRILLDTCSSFDAGLLGFDRACNPAEDGEGLIVTAQPAGLNTIPSVTLQGPDGEVELSGRAMIEQTAMALIQTLDPGAASALRDLLSGVHRAAA